MKPRPTASTAGRVSITPPGRSRLPVTRLSSWTAQVATSPNSCVETPTRPYTAADLAPASSRASRRTSSAAMPDAASARSGVNGSTAARTASSPSTYAGGVVSPSANSTCSMASSTNASVPGRTKWCSCAALAVSVRRGSTTTIRPPRSLQLAQPGREVGHRHQRAVGGHRVRPEDQEQVGPVDVGDGQQQLVAVHEVGEQLCGQLVDGRGAVLVAGPERLHHRGAVRHRAEAVHVGVAEVDRQRVAAVLVDGPGEVRRHQVERLVPGHLLPPVADAAHRAAQPVRVLVHVLERDRLGADVPARQRVVRRRPGPT